MRIPETVAETLRTERERQLNTVTKDEDGHGDRMQALLKMGVMVHNRSDMLNEYRRTMRQYERQQKVHTGSNYQKDPLAEFEKLWDRWEFHSKKVTQLTYPEQKEREFQAEKKRVNDEY